jgi:hypothetical protein
LFRLNVAVSVTRSFAGPVFGDQLVGVPHAVEVVPVHANGAAFADCMNTPAPATAAKVSANEL